MKLSLNWLKDYVDPKLTPEQLVHRMTMAGLEVEEEHIMAYDTVLDLEVTPNRPDCLNTIGLAREISAMSGKILKIPTIKNYPLKKSQATVTIEDRKDCSRYVATLLSGSNIIASPQNISDRLRSLGLNPINNAVDITNFVLMEMGQPLHVFDYDKLEGGKIIVRRAKKGESITTLDGIERKLDPSILVIADAKKPVAIAGIMGGMDTAISSQTKKILLESAHFDLGLVRRGSRALGLKSDSSYRFERGVDISGVLNGANRATDLLITLTQAKIIGRVDAGLKQKLVTRAIDLTIEDIEKHLGTKVSAVQVKKSLTQLGMKVTSASKGMKVRVPSFRGDLKQRVDLIEEVARIIGYDNLDVSFPTIQVANIEVNPRPREIKRQAADVLVANGFCETISYSLINQKDLDKTLLNELPVLRLHNALSGQHNILRPSLFPSLLTAASTNFNRGQKDLKLFEFGKRYFKEGERPTLGILITGRSKTDWRHYSKSSLDFYDLKGVLEQIFGLIGAQVSCVASPHPTMDPSACAKLMLGDLRIGTIGRVNPSVLKNWDIKTREIYMAGIHIDDLYIIPREVHKYQMVNEYPAIHRDVSISIPSSISYERIKDLCLKLGGDILTSVNLIEQYTGDKIQAGLRGLVFSLIYQSGVRTLREEEVNSVHQRILDVLSKEFKATLR